MGASGVRFGTAGRTDLARRGAWPARSPIPTWSPAPGEETGGQAQSPVGTAGLDRPLLAPLSTPFLRAPLRSPGARPTRGVPEQHGDASSGSRTGVAGSTLSPPGDGMRGPPNSSAACSIRARPAFSFSCSCSRCLLRGAPFPGSSQASRSAWNAKLGSGVEKSGGRRGPREAGTGRRKQAVGGASWGGTLRVVARPGIPALAGQGPGQGLRRVAPPRPPTRDTPREGVPETAPLFCPPPRSRVPALPAVLTMPDSSDTLSRQRAEAGGPEAREGAPEEGVPAASARDAPHPGDSAPRNSSSESATQPPR